MLATVIGAQPVPMLVNYQGRLANPDGSTFPTADYSLTVRLYDAQTGGALVWGPQLFDGEVGAGHGAKVPVVQGYFNVVLGPVDTSNRSMAMAFAASNRFVEITVSNRAPLLPRQQILSTPYAIQAGNGSPPGTIVAFGGNTNRMPTGWLLCDGRSLRSGEYPELHFVLYTNWGNGVPASGMDFNLPDLRGMILRGVSGERKDGWEDPQAELRLSAIPLTILAEQRYRGGNPGNHVGSVQGDFLPVHSHRWGTAADEPDSFVRTLSSWTSASPNASQDTILQPFLANAAGATGGSDNSMRVVPRNSSLYTSPASTVRQEGELRPKNVNVHYIIKY